MNFSAVLLSSSLNINININIYETQNVINIHFTESIAVFYTDVIQQRANASELLCYAYVFQTCTPQSKRTTLM
jgi:hypothetical protein